MMTESSPPAERHQNRRAGVFASKHRSIRWIRLCHAGLVIVVLLGLVFGVQPAAAKIIPIDPAHPPAPLLEPAELDKLVALRHTFELSLISEVSPDDRAVVAIGFLQDSVSSPPFLGFLNIKDGSSRPIDPVLVATPPLTDMVWRDPHTVVYVSFDQTGSLLLVTLDRATGAVTTAPLPLPGFPVSIAPDASRVVVLIQPGAESAAAFPLKTSPWERLERQSSFSAPPLLRFDTGRQNMQRASAGGMFASFDLATQEVMPLVSLPTGSVTLTGQPGSATWTPDGSKLALVRTTISPVPDGVDVALQDALGKLPPAQNPFFQGNIVDIVDFARGDIRPAALQAANGDGSLFTRVAWSPDGETLLTQVARPSRLTGRRYPIYQQPDRSALRFYDAKLRQVGTLDRPEINAPSTAIPLWISPDDLVVRAPDGLSVRLYAYNRISRAFRQ